MSDDANSTAAGGAAVRNELSAPGSATPALIEFALFGLHGLEDTRAWLVADGNAISARADKHAVALLRQRFGMRSPMLRGGWHSLLVFVLTFSPLVPIWFLNVLRFGQDGTEPIAAVAAAAIGVVLVVLSLLPGTKPVPRSTLLQSQVTAVLMLIVLAIGIAVTGGTSALMIVEFVVGGVGAVIATLVYLIVRRRDAAATSAIDNALENVYLDVNAEVAAERAAMTERLAEDLASHGADVDALRAQRAAAFVAVQADGNKAVDDHPESLPGWYMIQGHTSHFLPLQMRGEWPPA